MSRLRVAIDARPLQQRPLGGVGRYLANVLPHVASEVEAVLLADSRRPAPETRGDGVEVVSLHAPPGVPSLAWLEGSAGRWLRGFDGVFHGTFNALPLSHRGRAVLTIHDLAPQFHPEDFGPVKRVAWRAYAAASVRRARRILTVSEFVKGQIIERFGVDPQRVVVAAGAVDPVFDPSRAAQAPGLASSLGIGGPYVVALGGARRRALGVAIEAWRRLRQSSAPELWLAVVGQPVLPAEPGLVALEHVEEVAWATLLAGAQALCYPTRYEGFGLPALEALASGTPVVCAPVASLPELLGESACWCPRPTSDGLYEALARLLADREWYRDRREAGLRRAREWPGWDRSAATILEAYDRAS